MVVSCRMTQCPYYDSRGFCAQPIALEIDQMGMCSVLWRKGQPRSINSSMGILKDPITVIDISNNEIKNISKEEDKEVQKLV